MNLNIFCKNKEIKKQVKCETCKHYIDEEDAQQVISENTFSFSFYENNYRKNICYYCPLHKVPYDRILNGNKFFKTIPEKEIKVDKKGKAIL